MPCFSTNLWSIKSPSALESTRALVPTFLDRSVILTGIKILDSLFEHVITLGISGATLAAGTGSLRQNPSHTSP